MPVYSILEDNRLIIAVLMLILMLMMVMMVVMEDDVAANDDAKSIPMCVCVSLCVNCTKQKGSVIN